MSMCRLRQYYLNVSIKYGRLKVHPNTSRYFKEYPSIVTIAQGTQRLSVPMVTDDSGRWDLFSRYFKVFQGTSTALEVFSTQIFRGLSMSMKVKSQKRK